MAIKITGVQITKEQDKSQAEIAPIEFAETSERIELPSVHLPTTREAASSLNTGKQVTITLKGTIRGIEDARYSTGFRIDISDMLIDTENAISQFNDELNEEG